MCSGSIESKIISLLRFLRPSSISTRNSISKVYGISVPFTTFLYFVLNVTDYGKGLRISCFPKEPFAYYFSEFSPFKKNVSSDSFLEDLFNVPLFVAQSHRNNLTLFEVL